MIKLYDNGVYLLNGTEILEDTGNVSLPVSKEEAAKNTIAYGILDSHNTSGNMERLQIKFIPRYYVCGNYSDGKSFRIGKISGTVCFDKLS